MTTIEPYRVRAYDTDLRWRMVYQREALGHSYKKIATSLCVDTSTVWRTVQQFQRTGSVAKRKYNRDNLPRKVNGTIQLVVLHTVLEHPGIYLREIQAQVEYLTGTNLALSTICQLLHEQGFSRQKMRLIAKQRDDLLRAVFAAEMSLYNTSMFIFLDEMGSDRRNALRKYGYSLRGMPAISHKLLVRGQHLSTIACISMEGLLECETEDSSVNGETFYDFVSTKLLPHLLPFDGKNPHSVVVMDNASIHHVDGIAKTIADAGALLIFLPPYSPDYNPIEETFSKVKTSIKAYEQELEMGCTSIKDLVLLAFAQITQTDCYNWINHCGIYT